MPNNRIPSCINRIFLLSNTALMNDEEAIAAAPSGEVITNTMTDGSHLDSSCRRKDPAVRIFSDMP